VHSLGGYALKSNGTVWSFGSNATGERGSNVVDMAPPAAIPGLSDVVQVVAGTGGRTRSSKHGCARTTAGTVYCWGRGSRGRLGDGTGADQWSPVQVMIDGVTPLSGVTELSAGREFNCAVTADNVYCWGRGYEGQIGTGSSGEYYYATPVSPALTGVVALRSADRNTCATLDTGAVRCWGHTQGGVVYSPTPLDAFEPLAE
jgi:alpha-tubulin suppressor-like RCC1 family protein